MCVVKRGHDALAEQWILVCIAFSTHKEKGVICAVFVDIDDVCGVLVSRDLFSSGH